MMLYCVLGDTLMLGMYDAMNDSGYISTSMNKKFQKVKIKIEKWCITRNRYFQILRSFWSDSQNKFYFQDKSEDSEERRIRKQKKKQEREKHKEESDHKIREEKKWREEIVRKIQIEAVDKVTSETQVIQKTEIIFFKGH